MSWMTRQGSERLVVQLDHPRGHDDRVFAIEIFCKSQMPVKIVVRKKRGRGMFAPIPMKMKEGIKKFE
jgi:hypothetical protein